MQWYYSIQQEQFGPVDESTLFEIASQGKLSPEDLVWNSTMGDEWAQASSIETLFSPPTPPEPAPLTVPPPIAEAIMTRSGNTHNRDLMSAARASLDNNWGLAIGATAIYYLITSAAANAIPVVGGLACLIISGPMTVGFSLFFLALIRKQGPEIGLLFNGFNHFGNALGAYLLMCLFILLWTLLLIIPGIVAGYAYSMTFFIIADDPSIGPLDAITRSKEMMHGYKWKLFCLYWRFFGWSILCLFTFGIGYLWLIPYMQTAVTHFYEDIRG